MALSIMAIGIMALSIMALSIMLSAIVLRGGWKPTHLTSAKAINN